MKKQELVFHYQRPECVEVEFKGLHGMCLVPASADGATEALDEMVEFEDYLYS